MSVKFVFVIGYLLVSAFAEEQTVEPEKLSQQEKEASAEAKVEVILGDVKINDENVNKEVVEDIENTDNGVKASASALTSLNFNFEELLAKWFKVCQQNKESDENKSDEEVENKKEKNNENLEDSAQSEETPSEEMKSPCIYSYNVHARSSVSARSSASASASSSFYFYDPKEDEENDEGENSEEPQESDDGVDEPQENEEQSTDVESNEVKEHCNQQNSEDKEPLKTEDETQVEEVEQ